MTGERVRELEEQGHSVCWTVLNGEKVWIVDGKYQRETDEFEIVKTNVGKYKKQRRTRK